MQTGGGRNTSLPINRAQLLTRTQFTAEREKGKKGRKCARDS